MNWSNLDEPLLGIKSKHYHYQWTLRNAYESTVIFGGLGSGKTSGSGRTLALKFLEKGFGGCVLTVKKDEKDAWIEYCKHTGRENDLMIIEEGGQHKFNFLDYLSSESNGAGRLTHNLVDVLKTVIKATQDNARSNDEFWQSALEMCLSHMIDLAKMAFGTVTVSILYDFVQSIPAEDQEFDENGAFAIAHERVKDEINEKVDQWERRLTDLELETLKAENQYFDNLYKAVPEARTFRIIDGFFWGTLARLASKTRSIIIFTLNSFLFKLLQEPIYSLFCEGQSTVKPEMCEMGKIVLIHLPTKEYQAVGRICQIMFKYIWQKSMEKRNITENTQGVFLFADESHFLLHEHDAEYQTTARSSRIATVYLTQSLPNYYAAMNGDKAEYRVKGFLGTMGTHIFHCNHDLETNRYASELIGQDNQPEYSHSESYGEHYSRSHTTNFRLSNIIRPEYFTTLKTGGLLNNYEVEAIVVCQRQIFSKSNSCKATFHQLWTPEVNKQIKHH